MKNKANRRSSLKSKKSKQLRIVQTSRHFGVVHRSQTGHVLPKRTTSYALLAMIVLCVGVLMLGWTRVVTAAEANYQVYASVPGPAPSVAATIDSPQGGSHYASTPITVSGSCPVNTYISLLRNNFDSGVALCSATGQYSITTDLFSGINQLIARVYSFTGRAGPDSNMVAIDYVPQATSGYAANTSTLPYSPVSPSTSAGIPEPLLLKSKFAFLGYYIDQPVSWQVRIEGGTPPYAVDAQWGDDSHQLYSLSSAGDLSLSHSYQKTGGYHGSYTVVISSTDAAGHQTMLQLLAIVSNPPGTLAPGRTNPVASGGIIENGSELGRIIGYAWSGYGVVILMLISFWLGERREFDHLKPRLKRIKHA